MTDQTALRHLIEAVEAGEINIGEGATLAFIPLSPEKRRTAMAAYNGSLDAAKALHEGLLPNYFVDFRWWTAQNGGCHATVGNLHSGQATAPARAWLIAILKAYEART